jgi:glyoxylase-like metal-dependent hydrolase (beta-lactamase superfamily II)
MSSTWGKVKIFQYRHMNNFCYAVTCLDTAKSIVIDPGFPIYYEEIKKEGLDIKAVFLTHHDSARSGAAGLFKERLKIPVISYDKGDINTGEKYIASIGSMEIIAFHTPGHTQDSISLKIKDNFFSGDTLSLACIGYSAGISDTALMYDTLFDKIPLLAEGCTIWPSFDKSLEVLKMLEKIFPEKKEITGLCRSIQQKRSLDNIKVPAGHLFYTDMAREKELNMVYNMSDSKIRSYLAEHGFYMGGKDDIRAYRAMQYFFNSI